MTCGRRPPPVFSNGILGNLLYVCMCVCVYVRTCVRTGMYVCMYRKI